MKKETKPESTSLRIERGWKYRAQRLTLAQLYDARTCFWDIESSGLKGNIDMMFCAAVKPMDKKPKVFRIGKTIDGDRELCEAVRNELEKYEIIVHHYGDRFDLPFLQTRLLGHHARLLNCSNKVFCDTWWVMKKRFLFHSNRLAVLIDHLGTPTHKVGTIGGIWTRAACGDRKALGQIVEHNIADVVALEEVAKELARTQGLKFCYWK